jgi:hypothetical protein
LNYLKDEPDSNTHPITGQAGKQLDVNNTLLSLIPSPHQNAGLQPVYFYGELPDSNTVFPLSVPNNLTTSPHQNAGLQPVYFYGELPDSNTVFPLSAPNNLTTSPHQNAGLQPVYFYGEPPDPNTYSPLSVPDNLTTDPHPIQWNPTSMSAAFNQPPDHQL